MQDIFISTLPTLITSWSEAFPQATMLSSVLEISSETKHHGHNYVASHEKITEKDSENAGLVFWLHMNEDRQQWMTNAIETITKNYSGAKIVVLANSPNQAESVHALSLGAMGYCHAYIDAATLKEIKAVISHGGLWLGQDILQRLIDVSTKLIGNQPEYVESLLAKLTSREKEVAVEAAKGLSNKEIARILSITERTVKAHLAKIFERLGAKDRLQLALMLNSNYR